MKRVRPLRVPVLHNAFEGSEGHFVTLVEMGPAIVAQILLRKVDSVAWHAGMQYIAVRRNLKALLHALAIICRRRPVSAMTDVHSTVQVSRSEKNARSKHC